MSDSNPTRARRNEAREAFVQVLGDPFHTPEPIDGWYNTFKSRGAVGSQRYNLDEGHGTSTPGRPSQLDFFCDVDKIIDLVLSGNKNRLQKFITTYIVGDVNSKDTMTEEECSSLEQQIGRLLIARQIVPVKDYFTTLRRVNGERLGTA